MNERGRLIEILNNTQIQSRTLGDMFYISVIIKIADSLLENGVIVPPVKVGQTVYKTNGTSLREYVVDYFDIFKDSSNFTFKIHLDSKNWTDFVFVEDFGKTVFLTKEQAEKHLKGGAER